METIAGQHFPFSEEKNASLAALSKHDPTRPIDCRIPNCRHSVVNACAV